MVVGDSSKRSQFAAQSGPVQHGCRHLEVQDLVREAGHEIERTSNCMDASSRRDIEKTYESNGLPSVVRCVIKKVMRYKEGVMILDRLKYIDRYENLSPRISLALRHLADTDLSVLAPGTYPISGDEVVLQIKEITLLPESEGKWEAHDHHIDIQSPIRGSERIGCTSSDSLTPVSEHPERDVRFLAGGSGDCFILAPGDFVVLFPSDVHMPGLDPGGIGSMKKAVIKVLL